MNFRYKKFPVDPKNCPFPNKKNALRPVIEIQLESSTKVTFGYLVLIDSGADYCIFHASIGELMGINIKSGTSLTFYGTSGEPQVAYFHKITFRMGGHPHTADVGFSYDMEKLAYGILGQDGFFNRWNIKFEYKKENVEIKEIR